MISTLSAHPTLQVVLDGLAQRVDADVSHFSVEERLERAAVLDERERLARDLHDGLLQSLTGAALHLKALSRLIETNPQAAAIRVSEIEALITEQQCELRLWIENRLLLPPVAMASSTDFAEALEKLCRRAEWQWGIVVELKVDDSVSVPRALGDAIYRIFQEGLTNIGRHARARHARLHLRTAFERAFLTVADDGVGFPFRGQYDVAALGARNIGPASLQKRVVSLCGELVLTSELSGSRLDIVLPLTRRGLPGPAIPTAAA
jgi:signal transduction histidine kinase